MINVGIGSNNKIMNLIQSHLFLLIADFEANHYYEGEEGMQELTEQGQRTLQHLESLLINGQGDGQPNTGKKTYLRIEVQFFRFHWEI